MINSYTWNNFLIFYDFWITNAYLDKYASKLLVVEVTLGHTNGSVSLGFMSLPGQCMNPGRELIGVNFSVLERFHEATKSIYETV